MANAKDLRVAPISAADGNRIVKAQHYSGKTVQNSQLHLGVFLDGQLEGAMQFGPSLDKRKVQGLVENTPWNGFLELNRMAFSERLPRNSESRALAVAFRLIRKHYPHIQWVISFSDGTQSGDGTIYRASGFVLTGIRRNTSIWAAPSGELFQDLSMRGANNAGRQQAAAQAIAKREIFSRTSLTDGKSKQQQQQAKAIISRTTVTKGGHAAAAGGGSSMRIYKEAGFKPLDGFQLRYMFFLDPTARQRLTCPILPFSKIEEMGAGMYRGEKRACEASDGPAPPASAAG